MLKERENQVKQGGGGAKGGKGNTGSGIAPPLEAINYNDTLKPNELNQEIEKSSKEKADYLVNPEPSFLIENENKNYFGTRTTLYYKYNYLIFKSEILFSYIKLDFTKKSKIKSENSSSAVKPNNEKEKEVFASIFNLVEDAEILYTKLLWPSYVYKSQILYLKSEIKKQVFISRFNSFVKEKIMCIKNLKVEILNKKNLVNISNYYTSELKVWELLLKESLKYSEEALLCYKNESPYTEFFIDLKLILQSLIDLNLIISEFRPNMKPKFIDIFSIVDKVQRIYRNNLYYDKEEDDLPNFYESVIAPYLSSTNFNIDEEEISKDKAKEDKSKVKGKEKAKEKDNKQKKGKDLKDTLSSNKVLEINVKIIDSLEDLNIEALSFINQRNNNEILTQNNFIYSSIFYLELLSKLQESEKTLNDRINEIALQGLIDSSKIPKDVVSSILESNFIEKKVFKDVLIPSITNSVKTTIDSFEVLQYYKILIKSMKKNTFDDSSLIFNTPYNKSKNVIKVFRFLKSNLSTFSKIALEISLPEKLNDYLLSPIKEKTLYTYWIDENMNYNVNFIQKTERISHLAYIIGPKTSSEPCFFGRVPFYEKQRQELSSSFLNLLLQVKESENQSEQKKLRDEKYFESDFKRLIKKFGLYFLKSIVFFQENKKPEAFVQENIIEKVSIERLSNWASILEKKVTYFTDEAFCDFFFDLNNKMLVPNSSSIK